MDNISIIIRNRNEAEFIGFAIQSCLDQFENPEIIIVDNKSTDESLEIVNLLKIELRLKLYQSTTIRLANQLIWVLNNVLMTMFWYYQHTLKLLT